MIELVADLQARLEARADDRTRRWWTRYLRGDATFRGVPMDGVREEMHRWYDHFRLDEVLKPNDRLRLAGSLMRAPHTEDKLGGILLLQERLLPKGEAAYDELLPMLSEILDAGHLADWNVVDWCCVKVLSPLIVRDGPECERALLDWADADCLWRARCAIVPFAPLANRALSAETVQGVLLAAGRVLARDERFAKTAVGWVLRELSERQADDCIRFIETHLSDFSSESFRNATKRIQSPDALRLQRAFRAV